MGLEDKKIKYLVVDTTAFIQNAPLHDIAEEMITCQDVIDEVVNKRQLKRLVVLPYDLKTKEVFPENVKIVTDFAKKTGDYPSLSATDIKVMALTYQLEKEHVGVEHLHTEPITRTVNIYTKTTGTELQADLPGFYMPGQKSKKINSVENEKDNRIDEKEIDNLKEKFGTLECNNLEIIEPNQSGHETDDVDGSVLCQNEENAKLVGINEDDILAPVTSSSESPTGSEDDDDDDDGGWITPSNMTRAKKQVSSDLIEEKHVKVACMTTDFAMQNVLKQMNLNVAALDGRMIKQLRTFIFRCYACFKTTSIMTKMFCPKCGLNTLKKVAVSLDAEGKMQIHINGRRPLTGRGKKFSLPRMQGGKHPNNPILADDQPMPHNRATKLARSKLNPLDDDFNTGFSPFATKDVNSKSARLNIRPEAERNYWMRKNPNEARRRRK